jgi:hydroxymethylbilane synthase
MLGAILSREETRDVLVARQTWTLSTLPKGAVVGTSSLRRQAQLLATRPDLTVRSIRGNVDTRLRKVMEGEYDAAVMAGAGLTRLGLASYITQWLTEDMMVPAPGQGALAVQCRLGDSRVRDLLAAIHDPIAAVTTSAERQLLQRLGGGCSAPIGASAKLNAGTITLRTRVASVDGRQVYDGEASGGTPEVVAHAAAEALFAQGAARALQRETRE